MYFGGGFCQFLFQSKLEFITLKTLSHLVYLNHALRRSFQKHVLITMTKTMHAGYNSLSVLLWNVPSFSDTWSDHTLHYCIKGKMLSFSGTWSAPYFIKQTCPPSYSDTWSAYTLLYKEKMPSFSRSLTSEVPTPSCIKEKCPPSLTHELTTPYCVKEKCSPSLTSEVPHLIVQRKNALVLWHLKCPHLTV